MHNIPNARIVVYRTDMKVDFLKVVGTRSNSVELVCAFEHMVIRLNVEV